MKILKCRGECEAPSGPHWPRRAPLGERAAPLCQPCPPHYWFSVLPRWLLLVCGFPAKLDNLEKMSKLLEIYNLGKLTQGETERLSTPRMAKEIESVTKTSQQRRAQGQKASGWIPSDIQRRFMPITSKVLQEAKEKMTFPNSCCKANIILWYQSETGKLQENQITGHYPW